MQKLETIYVLGMLFILWAENFFSWKELRQLEFSHLFLPSPEMQAMYQQLDKGLGIRRLLECYTTDIVTSPCLYGLYHPKILLPLDMAPDDARLSHIFAHELTHFASKDPFRRSARCSVFILHWYNPIVWLYYFLARIDCNYACNAKILALLPNNACAYGETLLSMASTRQRFSLYSMPIQGSTLKFRLQYILKPTKLNMRVCVLCLLCVLLTAIIFISSLAFPRL